ncbi:MAG: GNAT family N-acetyltransferase [Bacteroidales bacterium]|jgi:L-amino acid N-acyltransferase YncA
MEKYQVIRNGQTYLLDEILPNIIPGFSEYKFDQYYLYPSKSKNNWESFLIERIKVHLAISENEIIYFFDQNQACLIGVRFSEWDKTHFGLAIAHVTIFYHTGGYSKQSISGILRSLMKIFQIRSVGFVSIRINGDDLDFIHAFENAGFSYFENVIWPIKMRPQELILQPDEIRLIKENELPIVQGIASNFQYQRGHYHCEKAFDIQKVNSMYAKWVTSAWERKENIIVIQHDGQVAGYFISAIDEKLSKVLGYKYGRMKSLALDGSFRGFGLGKRLFNGTCQVLFTQGAEIIDSGYSTKNHISAKLHSQSGFYSVYEEVTLHKWLR